MVEKMKLNSGDKLRSPEVLAFIGSEVSLGVSWTGIRTKLVEKFDIDVNPFTIKKAFEVYATRRSELVANSPELNKVIKKDILDSSEQLKQINDIMWGLIKELNNSNEKDVKSVIQIAREIREQIKISNDMSRSFIDKLDPSKINKIEYTKVVINSLKELEASGIITINKEAANVLEVKGF